MTSVSATLRRPAQAKAPHAAPLALWIAAATFVATALIVLLGHPVGGTARLRSTADYLFTAMLIPVALSMLAVTLTLHNRQSGDDGRVGLVGFRISAAGLLAFVADGVVTLASADPDMLGPLYPLAMLATIVGLVCMAVGAHRAKMLPRWLMPLLTVAWIFGGPIAAGGSSGGSSPIGFRGATFIFAAVAAFCAVCLSRRESLASRL